MHIQPYCSHAESHPCRHSDAVPAWRQFLLTFLALSLSFTLSRSGAAQPTNSLPDDPEKAWAALKAAVAKPVEADETGRAQPSSPSGGLEYYKKRGAKAMRDAASAREFILRFPSSPRMLEARNLEISLLVTAMNSGVRCQAERDAAYEDAIQDLSLPEAVRCRFRINQAQASRTSGNNAEYGQTLIRIRREFPKVSQIYDELRRFMLNYDIEVSKEVARELLASREASPHAKAKAQQVLEGTAFYATRALGKPLKMQFEAVDGRKVDLAKLRGKVILIQFWATWSPPYLSEKKVYDQYHDKGMEIIGVNFDEDKDVMLEYVKQKAMPWPQYFDGKVWRNRFAEEFNIHGLPKRWIVDKAGNLREVNLTASQVEEKVRTLLAE